jgi:hypothetical protein
MPQIPSAMRVSPVLFLMISAAALLQIPLPITRASLPLETLHAFLISLIRSASHIQACTSRTENVQGNSEKRE